MPSPFPGMNPYLERESVWADFHDSFLIYAREALVTALAGRYQVRVNHNVYIHERGAEEIAFVGRPDLALLPSRPPLAAPAATAVTAAPTRVRLPDHVEIVEDCFLEIVDRQTRAVVTVIELLSRSNKYAGPDRDVYRAKVHRVLRTGTGLVELDLLRGGPRMPWDGLPRCDYYAVVSRAGDRPHVDCWAVALRDRLPAVPVPLRPGEPEPTLDVQAVLHRTFDAAGYDESIYDQPPDPRLAAADEAWAAALRGRSPAATESPGS